MKHCILLVSLFAAIFVMQTAQAQEFNEFSNDGYNQNSVRPIHESHIMYKKTLWYRMSLKEKQNKPLFAKNNELPRLIIEAAKLGIIRPYENDSLRTRKSNEKFLEALKIPTSEPTLSEDEIAMGFGGEESGGGGGEDFGTDGGWGDGGNSSAAANEYFMTDFYLMEIREDMLFDKKRSRMIHDIQAITIILPAEKDVSGKGIEVPIASFSYKELCSNLFRDNPNAIWYSDANQRSHLNLEKAFDLRLFAARIAKFANGDDRSISDMAEGGDLGALVDSQRYEHWLVEYESNLWEN